MSACNNFTPRAVGVGPRDDVCLNCPFPEEAHPAPLSPIALDFEAAYFEVVFELVADREQSDRWFKSYRLGNSINDALLTALTAQHLAIVARVAQEEREKVFKEVMAEWTKPTIRSHAEAYQYVSDFTCWLQGKISRGTP